MAEEEENLEDAVEDAAATDDDSVENLDDLDWSDVESDLKEHREEVLPATKSTRPHPPKVPLTSCWINRVSIGANLARKPKAKEKVSP